MTMPSYLLEFTYLDAAALVLLFVGWAIMIRLIERPPASRPSVTLLMAGIRNDWMRTLVTRQPRIVDSNVVDSLRQSTAFFGSASMLALGAAVALIGDVERLSGFAADFTLQSSRIALEIKLILVIVLIANAFLKFVWANRVFGYCSIMMASIPNDPEDPGSYPRAAQTARINITAARSFNRGLESLYFAIATLAWLIGPVPLIIAVLATFALMLRREFASNTRRAVLAARQDPLR